MARYEGDMSQNPKEIRKTEVESTKCTPYLSGNYRFQVSLSIKEQFMVNLGKHAYIEHKICQGSPAHVILCIFYSKYRVKNYVDSCYIVETYVKAYEHIIEPINGV